MSSLTRGKKRKALEHLSNNRTQEARNLFERVCELDKRDIESWIYLVKINAQLGDTTAVTRCCRSIISIKPDLHEAHFHLGTSLLLQGKREEALTCFLEANKLQPGNPSITLQTGKTLHMLARFDEALEYYQQAITLSPSLADPYLSTGSILKSRGDLAGAIKYYRKAVHLKPDFEKAHSDLVCALNYNDDHDSETIFHEHVRWGQVHRLPELEQPENEPDQFRRIRVGYVSPDFCKHSVAFFFEPLLSSHDHERFETYCYSDVSKQDEVTQRLKDAASHWRDIRQLNHAQLAELVRKDAIDILVDLTGHTANSRVLAFTAKPAPIQVSYLGYPNTTGIATMDYRLTDAWADPPGMTDDYYTETLLRVPGGFLCYQPADYAPPVSALPATRKGYITFGSFNNLAKITPGVVAVWAAVLEATPGSHLVVKNLSFSDAATREHYKQLFASHGIDHDRLEFLPPIYANQEHLNLYSEIDIGLDTFPYNGTTTNCEAFWMGVPVITLAGKMHVARVGVSLLSQIGLTEFIAESTQDYVRIATEIAHDLPLLVGIRNTIRERMANSALCNARQFSNNIEDIYREIWSDWCKKKQGTIQ